jgi:hypothetical protein
VQRVAGGRLGVAAQQDVLVALVAHGAGQGERLAVADRLDRPGDVDQRRQRLGPQAAVQRRAPPDAPRELAHVAVDAHAGARQGVARQRRDVLVVVGVLELGGRAEALRVLDRVQQLLARVLRGDPLRPDRERLRVLAPAAA